MGAGPKAEEGWLVSGEVVSTFNWDVADEGAELGLVRWELGVLGSLDSDPPEYDRERSRLCCPPNEGGILGKSYVDGGEAVADRPLAPGCIPIFCIAASFSSRSASWIMSGVTGASLCDVRGNPELIGRRRRRILRSSSSPILPCSP